VPFNNSTPVLYCNRTLLEQAGITEEPALNTFDDLLATAKTVPEELGGEGV
jgi:sn-glycerol 3-phosphate transport system substrate-binding protein